ncbi:STAS domain-containing protein [Streptomyces sp. NPDC001380]|uniref:STAS domain-containing protein n=1 Tax=Streptomyces sp. NPDC001380 TaxID=3364566 RepID=UPI00367E363A
MRITGDHAELAVEGRLDVRTAADARAVLHEAVDGGRGDLVLDLGRLDSWDATGLGVIMGTHRRAGRLGRRLVLRAVPLQLQRLLVATRLHRILAIEGAVREPGGATLPGSGADAEALPVAGAALPGGGSAPWPAPARA